jgi:Ca-activated chloride channel family protein
MRGRGRMRRLLVMTSALVLMAAPDLMALGDAAIVNKANRLYNEGKYEEAVNVYEEVDTDLSESGIAGYNKGAALYKNREYEKAAESFSGGLISSEPGLEAKASYNMGNTKYKLGNMVEPMKQGTAARLYREALDYYKRAIELDESDPDAKFNYEFVKKELHRLLANRKPEPKKEKDDQEKDKDQDDQDEKDRHKSEHDDDERDEVQEKKGGQEDPEIDIEPEESQASEEAEEERDQEEQQGQGQQEQEQEERDEQGEQADGQASEEPEPGQMSERQARMLLDAYGQQEKPEVDLQGRKRYYEVLKDW